MKFPAILLFFVTATLALAEDAAGPMPDKVTFNAYIRPIFSNTCFACHGFDAKKREADLRLDTPEGAFAHLKDSEEFAIVPGDPEKSEVYRRVFTNDPEDLMPPPKFHHDLTPRQKALIGKWIRQGAKYEQHWAFSPIVRPEIPLPTQHPGNAVNPIDNFILANLEKDQIAPSPIADKTTLLRRLSLDLTGLPPSPEELDTFLTDSSTDAYTKQVDRLLASPHYGERMAVPWLDVVRFADTVGYHGDQNMNVFPYRDYIIKSFNQNKPFDRFTTEQIAGDLLPKPTDEQLIATGFTRLNLMTREGGAQPGEYLAKSAADRVRAIGAAWLGLTTGCAECHDHKFDPFTTRDFYSLGAFFADVRQWGVYADYGYTPNPDLKGFNNSSPFPPEIHAKNDALETRIRTLEANAVEALAPTVVSKDAPAVAAWAFQQSSNLTKNADGWETPMPASATALKGSACRIREDRAVVFIGAAQKDEALTINIPLPAGPVRTIRITALPDAANGNKVGRSTDGRFLMTPSFEIVSGNTAKPVKIAWRQADRRTPANYQNGNSSPLLEDAWQAAPAPWEEPQDAASHPQNAIYHLAETLPAGPDRILRVRLASADIGCVSIAVTPFGDSIPGREAAIPEPLAAALKTVPAKRSAQDFREIAAGWLIATTPDAMLPAAYKSIREEIIACRAGFAQSLVSQALPPDKIPVSHVLTRGNWMTPAEEVQPAVPGFLAHASVRHDGKRLTRLDLANWLTAKENPLTARQFTNRLWKQFFGAGLSNVLDDLGNQGEWPSHPQLLDWLAAEFQDSGWNIKHMVKLIVTSHTYQQTSAARQDLADSDPANRLLAEQSGRRLEAEFVRDNALAISGLLNDGVIGGPSVMPYQPDGYYSNLNFPERKYQQSTGADQYRRGVYIHWQRTFIHPMLAAFDAPSREECTADRFVSNSPQQALVLLNDPTFVEAARGFALRVLREKPGASVPDRIAYAVRLALARDATVDEKTSLGNFLTIQQTQWKAAPTDAADFLKTGLSTPGTGDPAELAAWTQVCRVLLNLHETITRY